MIEYFDTKNRTNGENGLTVSTARPMDESALTKDPDYFNYQRYR